MVKEVCFQVLLHKEDDDTRVHSVFVI